MPKFFLTNKAVEDITKIWEYTYEVWLEDQTDKYYNKLLIDCQEIAENRTLGKNYNEINKEILGCSSGQHLIF
jgi:toxin ParE1/3/4